MPGSLFAAQFLTRHSRLRFVALFWLASTGCSEALAPGTESSDDDASSTGGQENALASGGTLGSNPGAGGSNGAVDGTGGESTVIPQILATEIVLEEGEPGFCGLDGVIESTNAGYTAAGYANSDNLSGAEITWAVQIGASGTYSFTFRFASGSANDRAASLSSEGDAIVTPVSFPSTTDFVTWSTAVVEVTLTEGTHYLSLSSTTAEGLANIDSVTVTGAAVGPGTCDPDGGTGGSGSSSGGSNDSGGSGAGGSGPLANITVYVAGDSTVSTYTDTASPIDQAGWGQMLHEIFDDRVTVQNRAVGGRTALWFHLEGGTQWILDRILPGDYWFVQFGTNDSHPTATFEVDGVVYPRLAAADGAFKQHLKDYYITPARAKNAIPVLVTPPPRNSAYCGNGNSLGGYAQAMRDLAAEEDVILLDNNLQTFNHLAAICPAPTPENFFFLRADSSVDGTHFQENGARHMASFLGDEMLSQSVGPYLYLLP